MEDKVKAAEEIKLKGNNEFSAQNYAKAKEYYTQAIGKRIFGAKSTRALSNRAYLLWKQISMQCFYGMVTTSQLLEITFI